MGDVLVKMSRSIVRSRGVLILLLFCRDHSTPPLLVAIMAWDRLVSAGRVLTKFGVLARGAN